MNRGIRSASRRALLLGLGSAMAGSVAGCSSLDSDARPRTTGTTPSQSTTSTTEATTSSTTETTREAFGSQHVQLNSTGLKTAPLDLRLVDLTPSSRVTVSLVVRGSDDSTWRSEGVFETDASGVVVPDDQRPISGTYDRADEMGLIWSLQAAQGSKFPDHWRGWLTVSVDGEPIARQAVERWAVAEGVTTQELASPIEGVFCVPPGQGPHPGVLVLHGSGGRPLTSVAAQLATYGFAALALDYFDGGRSGMQRLPLAYFDEAVDWLRTADAVRTDEIGVFGYSRGTEAAVYTAARNDDVTVLVNYAPSAYAWTFAYGTPTWVRNGSDPDHLVTWASERQGDSTFLLPAFEKALQNATEDDLQAARLPVEEMGSDALFISGKQDKLWPATEMTNRIVTWLDEASYPHRYEHLAFENTGHAIYFPTQPTIDQTWNGMYVHGGTPTGIALAEAESWTKLLSYLDRLKT